MHEELIPESDDVKYLEYDTLWSFNYLYRPIQKVLHSKVNK